MSVLDYFKRVSEWNVHEVHDFLQNEDPASYNLVDVRQPEEYEQGHLPGAKLIPVGQLPDRLGELDPDKPTITY